MRGILIRIANAALFVLCCFIAGGIVSEISAGLLLPPPTSEFAPTPAAAISQAPWSERQVILDRNLFGALVSADSVPVEVPDEPDEEEAPVVPTELPLRLLGTVAAENPEFSRAAIEDKSTRAHEVRMEGEYLQNHPSVQLVEISRRRIILDNAGVREELALEEISNLPVSPAPTASSTRTSRSARAKRARQKSNDPDRQSTRQRLAERLKDLRDSRVEDVKEVETEEGIAGLSMRTQAKLFSEARITPKYNEGEMIGIQLSKIKEGSFYESIGIQEGDIIRSVNGRPINEPAASPEVLQAISTADSIDAEIESSSGEVRSISVNVKEMIENQ